MSYARLSQIADEIRELASIQHATPAKPCGHLILEAIDLGVFGGREYAKLRALISVARSQNDQLAMYRVFLETAMRFAPDAVRKFGPAGVCHTGSPAFAIIADAIKSEAEDDRLTDPPYVFRRSGNGWEIRFAEEHGHLKDSVGIGTIWELLQQPNPEWATSALILMRDDDSESRHDGPHKGFMQQQAFDNEALRKIHERLNELATMINAANDAEHDNEVETLEREREELFARLKADLGIGGKPRTIGPKSPRESARMAVWKRLSRTYVEMEECGLAKLSQHLKASIQREGDAYAYRPQPTLSWKLE